MQRLDGMMKRTEAKDEEIKHLRDGLKERTDSARGHSEEALHAENLVQKLTKENYELQKQLELLQLEKD